MKFDKELQKVLYSSALCILASGVLIGREHKVFGTETIDTSELKLKVQNQENENSVKLSWTPKDGYVYKVFSKKNGEEKEMGVPTKETIKVLNLYPVSSAWPNAANVVKGWMEDESIGKGKITVTAVSMKDFNDNPQNYLKQDDGLYNYDVVMIGCADSNCSMDLSDNGKETIEKFINAGGGFLLGHDTAAAGSRPNDESTINRPNLKKLSEEYLKVRIWNPSEANKKNGSGTEIIVEKEGLLTNYPHKIGDKGDKLTVPQSHNWYQEALDGNEIWMSYTNVDSMPTNFYLTTYKNCAMIQTGHVIANGNFTNLAEQATSDEKKLMANTLFYLAQLTSDDNAIDHMSQDYESPKNVIVDGKAVVTKKDNKLTIHYSASEDLGTEYEFKVQAVDPLNVNQNINSDYIKCTNISGIKGYSYIIDNNETVDEVDNIVDDIKLDSSIIQIDADSVDITRPVYIHIKAIDNAGNSSEITNTQLDVSQSITEIKEFIETDFESYSVSNDTTADNVKSEIERIISDNADILDKGITVSYKDKLGSAGEKDFTKTESTYQQEGSITGTIIIKNSSNETAEISISKSIAKKNQSIEEIKELIEADFESYSVSNDTTADNVKSEIERIISDNADILDKGITVSYKDKLGSAGEKDFTKTESTYQQEGSITGTIIIENSSNETAEISINKNIDKRVQNLADIKSLIETFINNYKPTNNTSSDDIIEAVEDYIQEKEEIEVEIDDISFDAVNSFDKKYATVAESGTISGKLMLISGEDSVGIDLNIIIDAYSDLVEDAGNAVDSYNPNNSTEEQDVLNYVKNEVDLAEGFELQYSDDDPFNIEKATYKKDGVISGTLVLRTAKDDEKYFIPAEFEIARIDEDYSIDNIDNILDGFVPNNSTTDSSVLLYIKKKGDFDDDMEYKYSNDDPFRIDYATEEQAGSIYGTIIFYYKGEYLTEIDATKTIRKLDGKKPQQSLEEVKKIIIELLKKYKPDNNTKEKDILDYINNSGKITNQYVTISFENYDITKSTKLKLGQILGKIQITDGIDSESVNVDLKIDKLESGSTKSSGSSSSSTKRKKTISNESNISLNIVQNIQSNIITQVLNADIEVPIEVLEALGKTNQVGISADNYKWYNYLNGKVIEEGTFGEVKDTDDDDVAGIYIKHSKLFNSDTMISFSVNSNTEKYNVYSYDSDLGKYFFIKQIEKDEHGIIKFKCTNKNEYLIIPEGKMIVTEKVASQGWIQAGQGQWIYVKHGTDEKEYGWHISQTNESEVVGDRFFLDEKTGIMKYGWYKDKNGALYYFDDFSGENSYGAALKGWKYMNKSWYHFDENTCKCSVGWQSIEGNWYFFYADGTMASDTTISGYYVGSDGKWVQ